MNLDLERETLLHRYKASVGEMPDPPPLGIEVLYKESRAEYHEWKITYTAETPATMPTPAGQRVSAYLLTPRWSGDGPFPAMVCFHQCNVDCVLAKEAVVGKTAETTPDQHYGFELVRQGFAVLAPDSLNCGERNIPALRQKDENKPCWPDIHDHPDIGRPSFNKKIYDGVRAVDVLQALDFVDSERIGAIGHSMGSHDAFHAAAYDTRVRAVILSGFNVSQFLPLHAPRLHMAYKGALDGESPLRPDKVPAIIEEIRQTYESARRHWEAAGAADDLVLRVGRSGHVFVEDFKKEAYARLKRHFGIVPQKSDVSLRSLLEAARQDTWTWNREERYFPPIEVPGSCRVLVDKEKVQQAFAFLFVHLFLKRDGAAPALRVRVQSIRDAAEIRCAVPARNDSAPVYFSEPDEGVFVENGATLHKERKGDAVEYVVNLPITHKVDP